MRVMLLNGPNINFTGIREPAVYGTMKYEDMVEYLRSEALARGIALEIRQSNHEGMLIDWIQEAYLSGFDALILNPGAYTHTGYALFDAIKSTALPAVEVHLSNIGAREEFRRVSVTVPACIGQISGFGPFGYVMAMDALSNRIQKREKEK